MTLIKISPWKAPSRLPRSGQWRRDVWQGSSRCRRARSTLRQPARRQAPWGSGRSPSFGSSSTRRADLCTLGSPPPAQENDWLNQRKYKTECDLLAEVFNVDYVFPTDLCSHANLCSLLHLRNPKFTIKCMTESVRLINKRRRFVYLLLHFLRKYITQINGFSIFPRPHQFHSPHKGQVVCDDLTQLREMPAIP